MLISITVLLSLHVFIYYTPGMLSLYVFIYSTAVLLSLSDSHGMMVDHFTYLFTGGKEITDLEKKPKQWLTTFKPWTLRDLSRQKKKLHRCLPGHWIYPENKYSWKRPIYLFVVCRVALILIMVPYVLTIFRSFSKNLKNCRGVNWRSKKGGQQGTIFERNDATEMIFQTILF